MFILSWNNYIFNLVLIIIKKNSLADVQDKEDDKNIKNKSVTALDKLSTFLFLFNT